MNYDTHTAAPSSAGAERPPGHRPRRLRLRCRSVVARARRAKRRIPLLESDSWNADSPPETPESPAPALDYNFDGGTPSSPPPPRPCEAGLLLNSLTVLHCNIRGWLSHCDELFGHIHTLNGPSLVLLNETLLDSSVSNPQIPGYQLVGRHEEIGTRRGIAAFAANAIAPDVVLLLKSKITERMWLRVHTQIGAILVCVWYRRPNRGEVLSVTSLREEYNLLKGDAIGTMVIGDLNAHHIRWLRYSSENSPEGEALHNFCQDYGFIELVGAPTRDNYLLDLVLTDLHSAARARVLPGVSDHSMVLAIFDTKIDLQPSSLRKVWKFQNADWESMRSALASYSWNWHIDTCPDDAAQELHDVIIALLEDYVPSEQIQVRTGSHPWFNEDCQEAVLAKQLAWGTASQREASEKCSQILFREYGKYIAATRQKLKRLKKGSKKWWKESKSLMHKSTTATSIPALKTREGWVRTAVEKADVLADTFERKWILPEVEDNAFSSVPRPAADAVDSLLPIRSRTARKFLGQLNMHSATGPDGIPSRVLRILSDVLAVPFAKLARCIVHCGIWPAIWTVHWICPLHKRKSIFDGENYRGIQLTAQISKCMERFLASLFLPDLIDVGAFGANQFAYKPKHGARDAILLLVLRWLLAFMQQLRIGIYCSDVSGAFDKVSAARLVNKLTSWGVHPRICRVFASWLRPRQAQVVVNGEKSRVISMSNMVYQGTVWGPPFWNTFFSDSELALRALAFTAVFYADDLNAFKTFAATVSDETVLGELREAQLELHSWGRANQVTFDAGKESFHILSRNRPFGEEFKILGITFDCKLLMHSTIDECVTACGWKLECICRTKRFFSDGDLVLFYKAHLLSYIEYRTPGIYHAAPSALRPLDAIQSRLLRQIDLSDIDALIHFHLAPLATRRDVAMLGVIHRTVIGEGPSHFHEFFRLSGPSGRRYGRQRHNKQLEDVCDRSNCPNYFLQSVFGLIAIYNLLPQYVVEAKSIKLFQRRLQEIVVYLAVTGYDAWKKSLNRSSLMRSVLPRITQEIVSNYSPLLPIDRLNSV